MAMVPPSPQPQKKTDSSEGPWTIWRNGRSVLGPATDHIEGPPLPECAIEVVPKALLDQERARADGYSRDYTVVEAQRDQLDYRLGELDERLGVLRDSLEEVTKEREKLREEQRTALVIEMRDEIIAGVDDGSGPRASDCERCKGSGVELRQGYEWLSDPCPDCDGTGTAPEHSKETGP